ncbi:MAG: LysM peptidoglycan-binding domain-containing protein [Acidobacteria bacterium]|nr:LysM peptidoglycan-binding domain-containing protein [Acidobacteriota bacterium]
MLREKYDELLKLGESLKIADGYVDEADGKLKVGGVAAYQLEKDLLWDKIKTYSGWEHEIEADIKVANEDIYGVYTVAPGDTLWKISSQHFGKGNRYMEIFEANKDVLKNPDVIKVGQQLKLPQK